LLTCIKGGRVIDPANARDAVADVWMHGGRIVEAPLADARADEIAEYCFNIRGAPDKPNRRRNQALLCDPADTIDDNLAAVTLDLPIT